MILSINLLSRVGELLSLYGKSLVGQWCKVARKFLPRVFKCFVFLKYFVKILSIRLLIRFGELLGVRFLVNFYTQKTKLLTKFGVAEHEFGH